VPVCVVFGEGFTDSRNICWRFCSLSWEQGTVPVMTISMVLVAGGWHCGSAIDSLCGATAVLSL